LVLSDKAEALQVVQDKLSEAMNRVRHVDDFPNPLLRLGRQYANFKKLVAKQTVNQVSIAPHQPIQSRKGPCLDTGSASAAGGGGRWR
jgi:hypothetical protein